CPELLISCIRRLAGNADAQFGGLGRNDSITEHASIVVRRRTYGGRSVPAPRNTSTTNGGLGLDLNKFTGGEQRRADFLFGLGARQRVQSANVRPSSLEGHLRLHR